jgi:hypothetical protein
MIKYLSKILTKPTVYSILMAVFFILVMQGITADNSVASSRIGFIVLLLFCGCVAMKRKIKIPVIVKHAFAFSLYMCMVALFDTRGANFISAVLNALLWTVVMYQTSKMRITDYSVQIIAIIMAVAANIMAIIHMRIILLIPLMEDSVAVIGAANAIYYVMTLLPFIFLIRQWWLAIAFMLIPITAFTLAGKTTCVVCAGTIIFYYFYAKLRDLPLLTKFAFLVSMVLCGIYVSTLDLDSMMTSVTGDFESGGSGRLQIYSKVLSILASESNPIYIIFGHGTNSIPKYIGIGGHNDFLEVIFCYGMVGLILYLGLWVTLIKTYIKGNMPRYLRQALAVSILVFGCASLASKLVATQIGLIPLAFFWGVVYSIKKQKR